MMEDLMVMVEAEAKVEVEVMVDVWSGGVDDWTRKQTSREALQQSRLEVALGV